jgi:hypothetical protein
LPVPCVTKHSGGLFRQGYGRIKYTDSRKNKTSIEEYRCIRMVILDIEGFGGKNLKKEITWKT